MKHPESEIALYVSGELDPSRESQVRAHLTTCASCRRLVDQIDRSDRALARVERPGALPSLTDLLARRRPRAGSRQTAATVVVVAIALLAFGGIVAGVRAERSATASAGPALPSATLRTVPPPLGNCAQNVQGDSEIKVCPARAPIGSLLTVSGANCNNPRIAFVLLSLTRATADSGTPGVAIFPDIPVDADGRFEATLHVPADFVAHQGAGGGPAVPGDYVLISSPPRCSVPLTITAR